MFSGFIRSAVNQVGRDSGKVISNAMYGDLHATPIRHVGNGKGGQNEAPAELTEEMVQRAVARQNLNVGTWTMVWRLFLGFCFVFIGPIVLIFNGLKRLTRREITVRRLVSQDIYEPSELGQETQRFAGKETYVEKTKSPSTPHERAIDRRVGTIYLVAGILFLLFHIFAYISSK